MSEPVQTPSGIPLEPVYGPAERADRAAPAGHVSVHPRATSRPGTAARPGRSASTRASVRPRSRTGATDICSTRAAPGLSVALDLPTQCGYDSDDPEYGEEVGRVGVAVDTLADAEILFDGIPLDKISTSFTINGTAAILLAFYVAAAEKKGVPREKLTGTIQNDILKEYASRGTWIWPPEPSLRLIADTIEFCAAEVPQVQRDLGRRRALPRRRRQRRSGDGVHAGRRRHLLRHRRRARPDDHRQVRAADLVLLLHPRRLLRGDREVPGGPAALGDHRARTLRRHHRQGVDVPVRLRVRRRVAVCAAGAEQPGAGRLRGDGRRCSAACSRCSPPRGTSRSRCPARSRRRWRCARSRSWPTRPA